MLDEVLHGATIAVLHNHVNVITIRVSLIKIDEVVGCNLPELEQNFPLDEGLMHFVDLA